MQSGGPELTLAERFRTALDACDRAYARGDATPVVTEAHPRLEPPSSFPPATVPQLSSAGPAPPPVGTIVLAPAPPSSSRTLRTIAIVAGVIVLAIGAWFIRKRLVEPLFYGRKGEEDGKGSGKGGRSSLPWDGPARGGKLKGAAPPRGRGSGGKGGTDEYDEPEVRTGRRVTFDDAPARRPERAATAARPTEDVAKATLEAQRLIAARQSALRALEALAGPDDSDDGAGDDPNFVPL